MAELSHWLSVATQADAPAAAVAVAAGAGLGVAVRVGVGRRVGWRVAVAAGADLVAVGSATTMARPALAPTGITSS